MSAEQPPPLEDPQASKLFSTRYREVTIEAGDFHVYPSDQFHRYRNEGTGRLRFIRNVVH